MHISKFTLTFVFLLISSTYFSQSKFWVDADWNPTSKENATYYKTISTIDNGELNYYFMDGELAKKETYIEGLLEGDYYEYYKTGELKETGKYVEGSRDGVWKVFYKNGKIKSRGKYRDGEKVGVWKTFYKNVYE